MAHVIRLESVGRSLGERRHIPGFGRIHLDTGKPILCVGDRESSFDAMVVEAELLGHDTVEMKQRLDQWVMTGTMPPSKYA